MRRSTLLTLVLALIAGALGVFAGRQLIQPAAPGSMPSTAVSAPAGSRAADIALPDLDGSLRHLHEWRGRPLLVNFWASWCAPCIEEMPLLEQFASSQGTQGVQVLGIALDEREAIVAFLANTPVSYPVLLDSPAASDSSVQLGNALGVLPFSVLIDADGIIRAHKLGPFRGDQLAIWLQALH